MNDASIALKSSATFIIFSSESCLFYFISNVLALIETCINKLADIQVYSKINELIGSQVYSKVSFLVK